MFSIGFGEIVVILLLAILLIGPKQIPDVMHLLKVIARLWQRLSKEFKSAIQEEHEHKKITAELKALQKAISEDDKS